MTIVLSNDEFLDKLAKKIQLGQSLSDNDEKKLFIIIDKEREIVYQEKLKKSKNEP